MSEASAPPGACVPDGATVRAVPIRVAFRQLSVGKTAGYAAVARGEFPLPVIRVGRKLLVARSELDRLLGGVTRDDASGVPTSARRQLGEGEAE